MPLTLQYIVWQSLAAYPIYSDKDVSLTRPYKVLYWRSISLRCWFECFDKTWIITPSSVPKHCSNVMFRYKVVKSEIIIITFIKKNMSYTYFNLIVDSISYALSIWLEGWNILMCDHLELKMKFTSVVTKLIVYRRSFPSIFSGISFNEH